MVLITCFEHHHRLILTRSSRYGTQGFRWAVTRVQCRLLDCISRRLVLLHTIRLSWPLLLVIQHRHLGLVLVGELFEKLEPRREMLHKCMFDFVWLAVLTDLQECFLQVADWTCQTYFASIRPWCDWLAAFMGVAYCREDAMGATIHGLGEESLLCGSWFRLGGVLQLIQVFWLPITLLRHLTQRLLSTQYIRTGASCSPIWAPCRAADFHRFLWATEKV